MSSRKVQRMRGSKTHGYGAKKKHRGKGSKGGKGYGGSTKHNRSYVYAKEPEHFGHKGFHSLRKKASIIKIKDLERISKDKEEIDLTAMGYEKLLSDGEISKPLIITIKKISNKAKQKIEKAGGSVTGLEPKEEKKKRERKKPYSGEKKTSEPRENKKEVSKKKPADVSSVPKKESKE